LLTAFIWYVPAFAGAEYGLDLPSPIAPMQARRNESRMKIDVKTLNFGLKGFCELPLSRVLGSSPHSIMRSPVPMQQIILGKVWKVHSSACTRHG
jgi:hypothetical protein